MKLTNAQIVEAFINRLPNQYNHRKTVFTDPSGNLIAYGRKIGLWLNDKPHVLNLRWRTSDNYNGLLDLLGKHNVVMVEPQYDYRSGGYAFPFKLLYPNGQEISLCASEFTDSIMGQTVTCYLPLGLGIYQPTINEPFFEAQAAVYPTQWRKVVDYKRFYVIHYHTGYIITPAISTVLSGMNRRRLIAEIASLAQWDKARDLEALKTMFAQVRDQIKQIFERNSNTFPTYVEPEGVRIEDFRYFSIDDPKMYLSPIGTQIKYW